MFYTFGMESGKTVKRWERTNTSNLWRLASSGGYYARVKVSGREKWKSLNTKLLSVAKLRLADFEGRERSRANSPVPISSQTGGSGNDFITLHLLEYGVKGRSEKTVRRVGYDASKLRETWPEFDALNVRSLTESQCLQWAARLRSSLPASSFIKKRRGINSVFTGRILRYKECRGALTAACKAIDISRMTHHDLRHLFATRCIESGVDIPTVSRWLGHADGGALAMRTYGHLRQDHSLAQAAKVTW